MKLVKILLLLLVSVANSSWDWDVDTDPITDEVITLLSCRASSGVNRWGERPYLGIRFSNGESIEIFINWGIYVGNSDLSCLIRVDDAEAQSYRVNPSTSNKATFFRGPSDKEKLFVEMLDGTEFICRFTPYSENPITATFSLYGLTSAAINGGIDLDSYRERVEEAIQRDEEHISRVGAARESGTVFLDESPEVPCSYEDSILAIGEEIVFQGEMHTIQEIDYCYGSSRISRVRMVPTSEYSNDDSTEGYWVTCSQMDRHCSAQETENDEQEGILGEPTGRRESAGEAAVEPYVELIGSHVIFYGEIHTIIDAEVRSGIVRYEIVPGDSTQADFSSEGIIVGPEHVTFE